LLWSCIMRHHSDTIIPLASPSLHRSRKLFHFTTTLRLRLTSLSKHMSSFHLDILYSTCHVFSWAQLKPLWVSL
jgi:hypothetical protein